MVELKPGTASSHGSKLQLETRHVRRFSEVESALHDVSQQTSFEPGASGQRALSKSTVTDLLSYLGPYNPRPLPLTDGDVVWLMDNTAFQDGNGRWQAEFVAAVFAQHPSCVVIDAVKTVADHIGLAEGDKELETIERRLLPFLMAIQPGKVVIAEFDGQQELKLGPGGRNGISSDIKNVDSLKAGSLVSSTVRLPTKSPNLLGMKTKFADSEGWAVISDIDDTIKITQTSDPVGILKSTFVDDATPVAGMPELYQHIQSRITAAAPFFYLSASPYNLYTFLREFRENFYPHGQLILRDASWMSIPGLLSNLTLGTQKYKVDRMHKIHRWLPQRKMICIGDSTQTDPESYGEIYRTFPGWVQLILIRKVTNISEVGLTSKNDPDRFEKAFEGVPKSVWHIFEDPRECYDLIDNVIG